MKNDDSNELPKAAGYAKVSAIASWPLGIILGIALSSGQDAAGAGFGFAMGLVFAMVASLFFGLAYWFCRSRVRIQRVLRYRRSLLSVATIATAVLVIWYTLPLFESQQYSVRVKNWSSSELLAVEIRVAGITTPIGRIQPGATIFQEGLTNRPTGAVTVRWVDDQGVNYAVTERSIGGPPRRYNGGELRINVQSQSDIDTYFLMNP